ncbi:MAG TPA: hypothetical protein VNA28_15160 [Solirubrobacteraceae bacterium]|nr:hypothetical protein [Solirubrobacteraceae bacterium]
MAGLATDDPRAAGLERRLLPPVVAATVAVLPLRQRQVATAAAKA